MRAGIVLVLLVSGCTHRIAPPAMPEPITPQFAGVMGPLAEGHGRPVVTLTLTDPQIEVLSLFEAAQ